MVQQKLIASVLLHRDIGMKCKLGIPSCLYTPRFLNTMKRCLQTPVKSGKHLQPWFVEFERSTEGLYIVLNMKKDILHKDAPASFWS